MTRPQTSASGRLFGRITAALRRNLLPGLILQAIAVALVCSYYLWPASQSAFAVLAGLKERYGLIYSLLATSLFGGIIPFTVLLAKGELRGCGTGREFAFYAVLWAAKGIEVDLFYRLQGMLFGNGHDLRTILVKTAVDQFLYVALWAAPCLALIFLWKEQGFSLRRTRSRLDREFFLLQIPAVTIANWFIWIPAVAMIYTMPPPLQIPMFNLVLCFFVLLLAFLTRENLPTEKT
jgi:hypothetical protein